MGFVVVYDACVLYPAPVRDMLMEIAISDLVQSKWTDRIHEEWIFNLVKHRPEIEKRIQRTRTLFIKTSRNSRLIARVYGTNLRQAVPRPAPLYEAFLLLIFLFHQAL